MRDGIILEVENFRFSMINAVPRPEDNTAYILYRENEREKRMLVITPQKPALSSQVRRGGFDRKMKVSTCSREHTFKKEMADTSGNFRFLVSVTMEYRIQNLEEVFRNNYWDFDQTIEQCIHSVIGEMHKKYDIEEEIEVADAVRIQILKALNEKIGYLAIGKYQCEVTLDERAKRIIDSKLDNMVEECLIQDKEERISLEIEAEKAKEKKKLLAEDELEKQRIVNDLTKAKGINELREELGENAVLALAYIRGEISTLELDERIRHNRTTDMMNQISALKQLVELDVIDGVVLEQAVLKLLGEEERDDIEQHALTDKEEDKVVVEDEEVY